jgi:hypothetical protein
VTWNKKRYAKDHKANAMKQLVLDLGRPRTASHLRGGTECRSGGAAGAVRRRSAREHFAYLWGAGVGKSHLLKALASAGSEGPAARALYLAVFDRIGIRLFARSGPVPAGRLRKLSPLAQIDAFALFNEIRANNGLHGLQRHGGAGRAAGARRPAHPHGLGPDLPDPRPDRRRKIAALVPPRVPAA